MRKALVVLVLVLSLPIVALAGKPATRSATLTVKTTIEAIDYDSRSVTFRDQAGNVETVHAGPEVKRFDELKVGDTVTFSYTASVVVKVQKPGEKGAPAPTGEPMVERHAGAKPGATISQQETATVLVKAVDPSVPSVTVEDEDGRTLSFRLQDKGLVKQLKAGDRVEITYTEALMISVQDSASPSPGK